MYAYLNAGGDVLGVSTNSRTLVQAQAIDATITTVITGAPADLIAVLHSRQNGLPAYYHQKTSGDGTLIGHYSQVARLDELKQKRFDEINERTEELFVTGVEVPASSGIYYSLSLEAQNAITQGNERRNEAGFFDPDPYVINSIDDTAQYVCTTATMVNNVFIEVGKRVRAIRKGGTDLKESIRQAATKGAVDAVVDTR